MATAVELVGSLSGRVSEESPEVELLYTVYGTNAQVEATEALEAELPPTFWLSSTMLEGGGVELPFSEHAFKHVGGADKAWEFIVKYGGKMPPRCHETITFDTGGETTHIVNSIRTLRRYPELAPDLGGAIGVTHDAVVGVDIGLAAYKFTIKQKMPTAEVTRAYRKLLKRLTKTTNQEVWRGFPAGEVLLESVTGGELNYGMMELLFHFAQSDNADDITVGFDTYKIQNIVKRGWEYLWIRWASAVDQPANPRFRIKVPEAVYIEQVYRESDFALLGIETAEVDYEHCQEIKKFKAPTLEQIGADFPDLLIPIQAPEPDPVFETPIAGSGE